MSDFLWSIPDIISIAAPTLPQPRAAIDHVAAGLARLPEQFRKTNIIALLTIFLQRYNDLETAYQALLNFRQLGTAFGVQLDAIGKLVGQLRNGLSDADYTRYIRARIAVNNSDGTIEDLITVARLVLNDALTNVQIIVVGPAAVIVRVTGNTVSSTVATIMIDMLRGAHAAGVRLIQESFPDVDGNLFHFESITYANAVSSIGNTTISTVDKFAGFPTSGSVVIDTAGNAETVAYTYPTGTPGTSNPLFTTPLTKNHLSGVQVLLSVPAPTGKGWGDSTEGSTVTPYSPVGTTGGELMDARE